QYAQFADITVCDQHPDYLGPLAGIQAAARQSDAQLLLITPCDTPNLDVRYPIRMLQDAATVAQTRIAYDGSRRQQLHLLIARQLALSIEPYLAAGERSVKGWLQPLDPLRIDFSDCAELFQNINTETEFSDWSMQQQKQQPS